MQFKICDSPCHFMLNSANGFAQIKTNERGCQKTNYSGPVSEPPPQNPAAPMSRLKQKPTSITTFFNKIEASF